MNDKTMTWKQSVALLTAVAVISALLAAAAMATPASGIVSGTVMARASFVDAVDIKLKVSPHSDSTAGSWMGRGGEKGNQHQQDSEPETTANRPEVIRVTDARETVMQQIVIGPGGQTGWHSHPGPAIVLVKAGELTFYSAESGQCSSRTFSAGQAFIDSGQGHVHAARNLSLTQNTELWVTYFDVPPGQAFRLDAPDPGICTF